MLQESTQQVTIQARAHSHQPSAHSHTHTHGKHPQQVESEGRAGLMAWMLPSRQSGLSKYPAKAQTRDGTTSPTPLSPSLHSPGSQSIDSTDSHSVNVINVYLCR
mmetsp:Transcript_11999/g.34804  ORF Transcript_11999/g.34804 Transcript_11999/m.34804 type:complete len:105 (-) Transcript_11999:1342-1656(-)